MCFNLTVVQCVILHCRHFVDDITMGPLIIGALATELEGVASDESPMPFLDCHMMVSDPYKHVERTQQF